MKHILLLFTFFCTNWVYAQKNQKFVYQPNTIVKITAPQNLNGDTLFLPNNVTLSFLNNGHYYNGVIKGQNTKIIASNKVVFKRNVAIAGTWKVDKAFSDWFDCAKNGYSIDYKTFLEYTFSDGTKGVGYKHNGLLYKAMSTPKVRFTDDTYPLNQLLNLKAIHTVISNGIYMVKATNGHINKKHFTDPNQGLLIRDADDRKLEINGTLKVISNGQDIYNLLVIYKSDNFELFGTGKLEGDIYEHTGTTGEAGFLLAGTGLTNFKVKDLTIEGAWGDGIYIGWSKVNANENVQHNHIYENLKINNCRRTGVGFELGDDISFINCKFDGHKNLRGTPTYAAIDIEPFGYAEVPIKICKNINVIECDFRNYKKGPAVRYERVVGGTIQNSTFFMNSSDITLGRSHSNDEIPIKRNHSKNYNYVEIFNNVSDKSSYFLRTIDPKTLVYQSNAIAYDNIISNAGNSVLDGIWKNLIFENNTITNAKNFGGTFNGINIIIRNNQLINVPKILGFPRNEFLKLTQSDIAKKYSGVTKFQFINNK